MTLRFVLLGHPVAHSLSPAIHTAAYRALGLAHRYELCDTPDDTALARAVAGVRSGELAGANVTVPWKREALALADHAEATASDVGAANVLARDPARGVVAHNTDVSALVEELGALLPSPERVLVLGSGGASLAAIAAARALGAPSIGVSSRKWTHELERSRWPHVSRHRASSAPNRFRGAIRRGGACGLRASREHRGSGDERRDARRRRRATTWRRSSRGQRLPKTSVAYDLVYNPSDTPFQKRARDAGLVAAGGLGMLVGASALERSSCGSASLRRASPCSLPLVPRSRRGLREAARQAREVRLAGVARRSLADRAHDRRARAR